MFQIKYIVILLMTILGLSSLATAYNLDLSFLKKTHPVYNLAQKQTVLMFLASDPKYAQIVSFLPNRFHLLSSKLSPELQDLIDHGFEELIHSERIKSVCQENFHAQPNLIQNYFGVSDASSLKISNSCALNSKIKTEPIPNKRTFPREYIFIFSEELSLPLDSWTNQVGVTFLFINPKDITSEKFFRLLLHELAITLDLKEQLSFYESKKAGDQELPKIGKGKNHCLNQMALRKPAIKYSFSTIRALHFENEVMTELNDEEPILPSSLGCEKSLLKILPFVASFSSLLDVESQFTRSLLDTNECSSINSNETLFLISQLFKEHFEFSDGKKINACEYLSEPALSLWTFSPTAGGPRPRIGGWHKEPQEDMSELDLRNLELKSFSFENFIKNQEPFETKRKRINNLLEQEVNSTSQGLSDEQ